MNKIYQKKTPLQKILAKSVLGGFTNNVILRSCNSASHPLSFKRTGFTLIELLVVVLIIGILAAVALPQYQTAVWKSRLVEMQIVTKAVKDAQEIYYMANGEYTRDFSLLDVDMPGGTTIAANGDWLLPGGATVLVKDPSGGTSQRVYAKNGNLGFAWYMEHQDSSFSRRAGKSHCIAYNGDSISRRVCESMGGVFLEKSCVDTADGCLVYQFP